MSERGPATRGYSSEQARSTVRKVALGTTLLALVIYLVASFAADLTVNEHFHAVTDARLDARLDDIAASSPSAQPIEHLGTYVTANGGDLDDAPIVVWWVNGRSGRITTLMVNAPSLPKRAIDVALPGDAVVAGRPFRLTSIPYASGRLIAGTSEQDDRTDVTTLVLIEAILSPIVLLVLYGAAWLIGRAAALPIERARRRQLEFTADASHELRTPLSVIEAEVGLSLSSERSRDAYKESLDRVRSESKRLREIVEDLLWLARLDAVPDAPSNEEVDLASVAEVCVARFDAVAERRGIAISTRIAPDVTSIVVAPAAWLDRLAAVLIDNACRYVPDGGHVEVSVVDIGGRVAILVDDDGPGVPDDESDAILRRFHRVSAAPGGAGLGLSIADAVVGATSGSWAIGRSPLGGARFSVSWPAAPAWEARD